MPRRSVSDGGTETHRTEHLATRVTREERDLIERAAREFVRREPQLLSLSDFIRALLIDAARRQLSDPTPKPTARRGK